MKSEQSKSDQPPRYLTSFIKMLVARHLHEEILGDLHERYMRRVKTQGASRARRRYWLESLAYIRPRFIKRQKSKYPSTFFYSHDMIRNYFKLAYRNIIKNKAYSIINISGLAIGLASSILILLWVQNELSYDKFHKNADQIYRIIGDFGDLKIALNTEGMPSGLKEEIPVIKNTVRLSEISKVLLEVDNKRFEEERVFYADPSFMNVFSFRLILGDRATALKRVDGVLLTQEMATKYFGIQNPIGKFLRKDNSENVIVTGVLANIPANSDLQFDFIFPMASLEKTKDAQRNIWESFSYYSYLQFDQNFDPSSTNLATTSIKIEVIKKIFTY